LLSFNFHTLLHTLFFFTIFLSFLLSTTTIISLCCNSHDVAFTSLKNFLSFLPTSTKSISVSFPPALNITFFFCFQYLVFATHSFFFIKQHSSFAFLSPIPFPPRTFSKPSICFPTCPLKSLRPRTISPGLIQMPIHHKNDVSLLLFFHFVVHMHIPHHPHHSSPKAITITLLLFLRTSTTFSHNSSFTKIPTLLVPESFPGRHSLYLFCLTPIM